MDGCVVPGLTGCAEGAQTGRKLRSKCKFTELKRAAGDRAHYDGGYERVSEGPMPSRKVERIASDLDDISIELDELREESPSADAERLEEVKNALDRAGDVLDDVAESHD